MSKQSKWMPATLAALLLTATTGIQGAGSVGEAGPAAPPSALLERVAQPRNLLDLTVDTVDAGPVVTLALDGETRCESFLVEHPDRLVVDLHGVVNRLERYRFAVAQGGVLRVRAGQHQLEPEPITRVVFDLEQPLAYEVRETGAGVVIAFSAGPPVGAAAAEPVAAPAVAPAPSVTEVSAPVAAPPSIRAVAPDVIAKLLAAPAFAAPVPPEPQIVATEPDYETRTIASESVTYSGKRISLNLVDADIKQVFRLFHEISGLNFVLDPAVAGRVTIVLDDVPWDQALDIILKNNGLDKVLEDNVIRIASTKELAAEAGARKQLKEAKELEVDLVTITRTLSYAKAQDVAAVLSGRGRGAGGSSGGGGGSGRGDVLSTRGRLLADERTNTLIISDVPSHIVTVEAILATLDRETPQVMIEARMVETSTDFVQDLGVVWGFTAIADASRGTATGLQFPHNASARYGLNLPGAGSASNLAFKFGNVIDSFTLDVALNTLEREGHGRVLSSPKIAAQNNERAEIEQGVRIPIVNTTATEINVEFVSASLKMTVTPQITAEGTIILDLIVENNSPDFVNVAAGIPSIRTQRAQTKVLINDGGTTVIGGIFTVNEVQSEVGVPWFRKIPVFGWLFKSHNITNQNRELLIFITPKIMRIA